MSNDFKDDFVIGILALIVVVGVALIASYFEMRSFNRCTGSHASYSDTLFTELRVMECKN